ncbi:MAG: GGDEF domain-containing protein [Campylobacterota bacterium]|nr:GGDEF domain-containing protein [Campylobacterota bacterium]
MTIQSIIKKAIKRLELEGKLLTPDFYAEAFCKEAQKAGIQSDDCSKVEAFKNTLNKDFQKELKNYNLTTMSELSRFLISKLNRTNPSHCADMLDSQSILIKRILYAVEMLHNKQATALATQSIKLLSEEPTALELDQFKQLWMNFTESYDDTFLEKLKLFGDIDRTDLKTTIEKLKISKASLENSIEFTNPKEIASLLVSSLVPSISSTVNEKILLLSKKIKQDPNILNNENIDKEIKKAISLRIALDKESVKEMISSLDGVLDKLSNRLIEMIESSDSSNIEIKSIKKELESYSTHTETNFKKAHQKLFTIAIALEKNTQSLSKDLRVHSDEVTVLSKKIQDLEVELVQAKESSKEDFLTKLYNKRALDEHMQIKEGEFERYGHNYSIVMFDLDHFKNVNDNFGHAAGDAVLAAFAKILKKETRNVDIVGRFGGEEFMAILEETDSKGGFVFAEKVRKNVQKARFMYKGERIAVTVSCGVCERKSNSSLKNTVNSSDENLYKAKESGRNKVVYTK